MRSLLIVHPSERVMNKSRIHGYGWHRCIDVLPKSVHFRHWTLGFRQYSFNLIAQALQSHNIHVFCCSPLYRHALVSSPFQVQVSRSPRSHCSELRPTLLAILSVRDTAHRFRVTWLSSDLFREYRSIALSRMMLSTVSAFCISHTSRFLSSGHLFPFAL